jgi:uncharacterized membrane protein YjfL (UPF0719 family)
MSEDIARFLQALGATVLWSIVAIIIVAVVFEVLDRRYKLMKEIFDENSTAAAIWPAASCWACSTRWRRSSFIRNRETTCALH